MAELGALFSSATEREVQDEMMDFAFVRSCNDVLLLQSILKRLQSGIDGHYPELIKETEQRVLELLPSKERKRMQALNRAASIEEIQAAEAELRTWQEGIHSKDAALKNSTSSTGKEIFTMPSSSVTVPVRGTKPGVVSGLGNNTASFAPGPSPDPTPDAESKQRISGYDFRAWEKFDVDAAVSTMDEQEHSHKKGIAEAKTAFKAQADSSAERRRLQHETLMERLRAELGWSQSTEATRAMKSDRERQKGNEYFKTKEYESAYDCYSRSLACSPTSLSFANRAMAGIKLERYDIAVDDCTRALELDAGYNKALIRRGMAKTCLGQYSGAIEDFSLALTRDQDNSELLKLLDKAKAKYLDVEGHEYGQQSQKRVAAEVEVAVKRGSAAIIDELASYEFLYRGVCEVTGEKPMQAEQPKFTRIAISEEDDEDDDEEVEPVVETAPADPFVSLMETVANLDENHLHREICTFIEESLGSMPGLEEQQKLSLLEKRLTALLHLQAYDSVLEACRQVLETNAVLWALLGQAEAYKGKGDLASTRHSAEKALSLFPGAVEAQTHLAWLSEESNRLKEEGNKAAGINDTVEALKLYNASLVADPQNIKSRNNRSQMLLKLNRFEECLLDTKIVLAEEPRNVKAMFREAQAYEGLAKFQKASALYDAILKMEPSNTAAVISQKKLQERLKTEAPPLPAPSKGIQLKSSTSVAEEDASAKVEQRKKAEKIEEKVAKKLQNISLNAKAPEVPTALPATVYELERVWRGLRGHTHLFAQYLCNFKKSTFKKVFKETVSHDLLSSVFKAVKDHVEDEKGIFILEGVASMEKMSMTMALLPDEDITNLRAALTNLESKFSENMENLGRLKAAKALFLLQ